MGLEFAEGFAGWKVSNTFDSEFLALLQARWTDVINATCSVFTDSFGKYFHVGPGAFLSKTMSHHAGWTVGFRFRVENTSQLWSCTNNAVELCSISVNADKTFTVRTSNGTLVIATSDVPVHTGKWYYLEISMQLSGTTNINVAVKVRLSGGPIIDANLDSAIPTTQLTSNTATINRHTFSGAADYRDMYFNNTAESWRGDIKIVAVRPNGDVVTDMTPTGGGLHYTQINEEYSDSDTTYVADGTVGHKDIYDWEDIPSFSGTISAVQISIHARKDDEGVKSFKIVTGDTGAEAASEEFFLADDFVCCHTPQDVDPATGLLYTRAGFNAKRYGFEVTS